MKCGMVVVVVVVVVLIVCGKVEYGLLVEQVVKGYEQYLNVNLVVEFGQCVEVCGWEDLNVDCNLSGFE